MIGREKSESIRRRGSSCAVYKNEPELKNNEQEERTQARKYMSELDRCWSLWFVSSQKSQSNCLVANGSIVLGDGLLSWELGDRGVRGLWGQKEGYSAFQYRKPRPPVWELPSCQNQVRN